MKLEVLRFNSGDTFTSGLLFDVTDNVRSFLCYTLEDQYNPTKIYGETRIPSGTYKLTLRAEGGFHNRYLSRYGAEWHKGMIYVNEVPNYSFILWHVGNKNLDTKGCLLLGKTQKDGFIGSSRAAYEEVYPIVRDAILSGEEVTVTYKNFDGNMASNKSTDHVVNISQVSKNQEDIMDILSTEIKHLKAEVKALRQAIILKGMQVK
jgi:hypothetical protein|tara:strand:- start:256 stop:873 length:618 start_codon:yes stop_codon:yes gene_type:complete